MITVTNEMACGKVEYTSGEYKLSGDFKVVPSTGKINMLNANINNEGGYVGNVSVFIENNIPKYTYNRMTKEAAEAIVSVVNSLVDELELKYKPSNTFAYKPAINSRGIPVPKDEWE